MSQLLRFPAYLPAELRASLGLPDDGWSKLEALLDGGRGLAGLLAAIEELGSPPAAALPEVALMHREFLRWKGAARRSALPHELVNRTRDLAQLAALERFAKRPEASQEQQAELLAVWNAAVALTMSEGEFRAVAAAPAPGRPVVDPDQLGSSRPEEVSAHRWLAWRRAEREGRLELRLTLPRDAIRGQLAIRPGLSTDARFFEEAICEPLFQAIHAQLDRRAMLQAAAAAAQVYQGLLETPPLLADRLVALFIGAPRQALGGVLLERSGRRLAQLRLPPRPGWEQELGGWLRAQQPDHCCLPTGAVDHVRLQTVRRLVQTTVTTVRPAGLAEARQQLPETDQGLPGEVASALILARRAMEPWSAWSSIDPVALGLAEYQQDLDEEELRARLAATLTFVRHQRRLGLAHGQPPVAAAAPPAHRLNPLVRSLADLRPGMQVTAVVTSLPPFGAFVTIGLEQEGLIHVSELADRFVRDPAEVVRLGQEVRARVLEVDPARGRISLSLRSGSADQPAPAGGARGSKGRAMAELERLFRKE